MVKRALTLLTSILIALHLLMPFNIYADTITNANVLGINTVLLSKSQNVAVTNSWYYVYQHTITLDADYIGTITLDVNLTYYTPSGSSSSYTTSTISNKTYFVNGNSITINQTVTSDNFGNQGPFISSSYLLKISNVVKTSTITELQQIIDLLTDIYNSNDQVEGLLNDQLEQLELVVSNTSLANQYLDKLSKFRQWNIPIESVGFVSSLLIYREPYDYYQNGYYSKYPLFYIDKNIPNVGKFRVNNNTTYTFVMYSNIYSLNAFNTLYEFDIPYTISNLSVLNNIIIKYTRHKLGFNLIKFNVNFSQSGDTTLKFRPTDAQFDIIMPIYFGYNNNISTEFALQYGLSNKLLDDLNIIANGTLQSNSAAQSTDSANEQLKTDSNTLFEQENGFKSDMQNAMNNVNNTFRLQDMGTKFVSSAQWVRTQYEQLTNNTPFASLITFSLITGLALILLGKVYR